MLKSEIKKYVHIYEPPNDQSSELQKFLDGSFNLETYSKIWCLERAKQANALGMPWGLIPDIKAKWDKRRQEIAKRKLIPLIFISSNTQQ